MFQSIANPAHSIDRNAYLENHSKTVFSNTVGTGFKNVVGVENVLITGMFL